MKTTFLTPVAIRSAWNVVPNVTGRGLVAVAGIILLFVYLLALRIGIYLPVATFWGSLVLVLSALTWQALSSQAQERHLNWALLFLLALVWLLKSIFVPASVPFFGSDAYVEWAATQEIATSGWLALSPWQANLSDWPNSTNYPLLATVTIALTQPIGFSITSWARWAMPLISLVSLCLVYAITLEIYRSRRVALLGSIGFGMTYMYLMFHSLYLRESIALAFFLSAIYTSIKTRRQSNLSNDLFYRIAGLLSCLGLVFAHHLTALLLLLFLGLILLVQHLANNPILREYLNRDRTRPVSSTLGLFLLVALITYWVYLQRSPLHIIHTILEDATSGMQATSFSLPATARYNFLLYSQILTTVCFGLLAVHNFLSSRTQRNVLTTTALAWGGLVGVASLALAVAGIPGTSSLASRFELFGYAFLLPAAASSVVRVSERRKWRTILLGLLFVYYGLNSVYRFPVYLYSQQQPNFDSGEVRSVLLPEEYALLRQIDTRGRLVSDPGLVRLVRPLSGASTELLWDNSSSPLAAFDYLLLGERGHHLLAVNGDSLGIAAMSRVYSSGAASVYVPSLSANREFHMNGLLTPVADEESFTHITPGAFGLLLLQIILICAGAVGVVSLTRPFEFEEFGLGIVLILLGTFVIYVGANLAGFSSPGPLILLMLLLFAGLSFRSLPAHAHALNRFQLLLPVAVCVLLFAYGPIMDSFSQARQARAYTEFYAESIQPCDDAICVQLSLTNNEGHNTTYWIDGQDEPVTLPASETWIGSIVLEPVEQATINLYKSPASAAYESLVLHFHDDD